MRRVRWAALCLAVLLGSGCQVASGLDDLEVPARADGEPCVVDPECVSGFCADGVCCAEACAGPCETCRATETRGTCTFHPQNTDPDGDCDQFGRCDGGGACTYDGVHQWSHQFGGEDDQIATGLAHGPGDRQVMVGGFNGSMALDNVLTAAGSSGTPNDMYVAAFDDAGDPQSSRGLGDESVERPTSVAVDGSGRVVVAGTFNGDLDFGGVLLQTPPFKETVFLATLLGDLTTLRAFAFAPQHAEDEPTSRVGQPALAIADDDSVLIAGHFRGDIDFGQGPLSSVGDQDYYLARFDSNGALQWTAQWGSAFTEGDEPPFSARLAADADGNAYVAGTYRHAMAIGSEPLADDGARTEQSFVAKLDAQGEPVWTRAIGGAGRQVVTSIATGPDQALVVVGVFTDELAFDGQVWKASGLGHVDYFVIKLDTGGGHSMSRTFAGSPSLDSHGAFMSAPREVKLDESGNVVLFGQVLGSVRFGPGPLISRGSADVFVAKLTSDLEHLWSKRYGDEADQTAFAGSLTADGSVVAAGFFYGVLDFGGTIPLESADGSDVFLVKFAP
ncbi:MAG: hypothetical protein JRI23_24355 [Deltaproteobacteria bacterium]|jgi:outer membrane protein assembly factor BamB|nr:hypothetical protein [Deltaproteobacteria bacterium]MBW2535138.1 hypothetical protein [Deltaproteobacteria bacterium]